MASAAPKNLFEARCHALAAQGQIKRCLGYRSYQVHRFVEAYTREHGQEPTYSRICDELGIATKGEVSRIVAALEIRGIFGRRDDGGPRIRLIGREASKPLTANR